MSSGQHVSHRQYIERRDERIIYIFLAKKSQIISMDCRLTYNPRRQKVQMRVGRNMTRDADIERATTNSPAIATQINDILSQSRRQRRWKGTKQNLFPQMHGSRKVNVHFNCPTEGARSINTLFCPRLASHIVNGNPVCTIKSPGHAG